MFQQRHRKISDKRLRTKGKSYPCLTLSDSIPPVSARLDPSNWAFRRTSSPKVPNFELVIADSKREKNGTWGDALIRNTILDLISSFMLQVATEHRTDVSSFLEKDEWSERCMMLADILVKHKVCSAREDGWNVFVPALVARGIVYTD